MRRRLARSVIVGIAGTIACVFATPVSALFVCSSSVPVCTGEPNYTCSILTSKECATNSDCLPGEGVCTVRISGTAAATAPATQITSIVLISANNVSITASVPPSAPSGTFNVVPTAANGEGIVRATDNLGGTCTVDVGFRTRAASVVAKEEICPQAEGYSLIAVGTSPASQPAGVTACAARLATCSDVLPVGFEFQNSAPASRVLTVRSPITGTVEMLFTKHAAGFESALRLFFSRSIDFGVSFTPFTPVPGQTSEAGSTRIRGTGQWSDIRVTSAIASGFPGLAEWGKVLLLVLMLMSIIAFSWRRGIKGDRASRHS